MFGCVAPAELVPGLAAATKTNKKRPHLNPRSPTIPMKFDFPQRPLPPQPKYQRGIATVSFHPRVSIQKCLHVSDYTAEERYQTWYNRTELKSMKRQCRQVLQEAVDDIFVTDFSSIIVKCRHPQPADEVEDKENVDSSNHPVTVLPPPPPPPPPPRPQRNDTKSNDCFRGLEGKTAEGQIKKRMLKENARQVVFREQKRQTSWGFEDPYAIAHEYHKATQFARTMALRLGYRDEVEALEMLRDDRRTTSHGGSQRVIPHLD